MGLNYMENQLLLYKQVNNNQSNHSLNNNNHNNNNITTTTSIDNNTNENIFDAFHDCKRSCEDAVEILNQLLLYEKLESNLLELDKSYIPIQPYLNNLLDPWHRQVYIDIYVFKC
jgi:hypothetical protein